MRALRLALVLLIGGVLCVAAIGKLLDNRHFAEVFAQWRLLPSWSLLPSGVVLSLLELALALWLFSGWRLAQAALVSVLFHLGYTFGTAITLLRGISLPDCGCFGILFAHPLDWPMAVEDVITALLSVVLYGIASRWKPRTILLLLGVALFGWMGVSVWKKSSLPTVTYHQENFRTTSVVFPRQMKTNIKIADAEARESPAFRDATRVRTRSFIARRSKRGGAGDSTVSVSYQGGASWSGRPRWR